jgi:hypothetical protein
VLTWPVLRVFCLALADACRAAAFVSRRAGRPHLIRVEQLDMIVFRHHFGLSPVRPQDRVAERVLTVSLDGLETTIRNAPDVAEFQVDGREGQRLRVALTDLDQAGNPSEPSEPLEFTVSDTVGPQRPGVMTLTRVEEVDVPDPEVPAP